MLHLGDITKIDGGKIPPVHIITFGSPCQNLSNIGNREGLAGSQSSLFYHAIRIIEEMRCATNGTYPVIAVWENVMGAFSSNNRLDFKAVLESFTDTEIPMPTSGVPILGKAHTSSKKKTYLPRGRFWRKTCQRNIILKKYFYWAIGY
ncbi:hypothetical protein JCM9152_3616 [Halalkalibacter hemicellulosilyticusJCM 9152]|uniref:Uncharacterized protein n=1 Tax=Halalkalibacter hemicellulosilyticusJCM 9152 TaxID=1236971 RepID=W4QKD5_9BACI|nr:hypothetical protein JCM9152_3616 [Halalkalibacter hemicellulosilyticusJCM 9152]